jgi:exosortase E/protease (VPEID-CTERM system)
MENVKTNIVLNSSDSTANCITQRQDVYAPVSCLRTDRQIARLSKQAFRSWFFKRIAGVFSLLVAEYLIFSILFDLTPLKDQQSWLRIFGYLGQITRLSIFIVTSLIVLWAAGSYRTIDKVYGLFEQKEFCLPKPQEFYSFLVFHMAFYVFLVWMTLKIFSSPLLLSLWAICALAAGLSALFALLPPQILLLFIRRSGKTLLIGSLIGIAAWAAGLWTKTLWKPLGELAFTVVKTLLGILPGEIIINAEHNIIGTSQFTVHIGPHCSGYQSIGLMAVFATTYLIWARKSLRFPSALVILPVAILVVWLANSIRIAVLIVIGSWGWPEIAVAGFHEKSGWLLFCILALAVVTISRKWQFFQRNAMHISTDETWNPTAAYLLPLLAGTGMSMITGLFSVSDVDILYPIGIIASGMTLWFYRRSISPLEFSNSQFSWAVGIGVGISWIFIDALLPTEASNEFPKELAQLPTVLLAAWLVFRIFGSCVVTPFVEELAFRGFLLRFLIDRNFTEISYQKFTWLSFIVSSLSFGLLHGRWLAAIIAGMLFALVLHHRGKLLDAVFAHALSNTVIAFYVLTFGRWSLWI